VTIAPTDNISAKPETSVFRQLLAVAMLIVAMTTLRVIYAGVIDLRTDEAYYWTWSKENVLSFLDHPPMIAWFIRFGTAIFGDTNLGVRFAGILAMLVTQLLLADMVRRVTHDVRAVVIAVLMPEAALYYGLLMAKVAPDVALIPFAVAMVWALVRLNESGDGRWWLAAGLFAGLALLSKLTVVMMLPAVAAFMLVPDWRRRWLLSPYPWAAALIAVVVFLPVLVWNAQHDWASFRFQFVRATATHELSLRTVGDFVGLQFGLVGFILLPVVLSGAALTAWRGYRRGNAVAVLLSTCVPASPSAPRSRARSSGLSSRSARRGRAAGSHCPRAARHPCGAPEPTRASGARARTRAASDSAPRCARDRGEPAPRTRACAPESGQPAAAPRDRVTDSTPSRGVYRVSACPARAPTREPRRGSNPRSRGAAAPRACAARSARS
jgi:hypothetical protein